MVMVGRRLIFRREFAWSALYICLALVKLEPGTQTHTHQFRAIYCVFSPTCWKTIRTPERQALQYKCRR